MSFALNQFLAPIKGQSVAHGVIVSTLFMFILTAVGTQAQEPTAEPSMAPSITPAPEAQTSPTAPAITVPDIDSEKLELLTDAYAKKGLVTLSANGESFPGIWNTDQSGTPLGAVLIFHDAGQTAAWPSTVQVLHNHLTQHGWATLSIDLPDPKPPKAPRRPDPSPQPLSAEQQSTETNNSSTSSAQTSQESTQKTTLEATPEATSEAIPKTTPEDTPATENAAPSELNSEDIVAARIQAAMNFLNDKGQFNIIYIGYGLGAARAARFLDGLETMKSSKLNDRLKQTKTRAVISRSVRALILINAQNKIPYDTKTADKFIVDWLNDKQLPILDIYSSTNYIAISKAKARMKAAKKKQLKGYSQVKLTFIADTQQDEEDRMTKRIRGFLNKYARGVRLN